MVKRDDLQMILFDVKAAVRLGTTEALWVALDLLFNLPDVANNQALAPAFVEKTLLPIGKAMVGPNIAPREISPLGTAPNTAARALTAICLAQHYVQGGKVGIKDLAVFGKDKRDEVRFALMLALRNQDVPALIEAWENAESPRLQEIATQIQN